MEEDKIPNGMNGFNFTTKPKSLARKMIKNMYPEAFSDGQEGHYDVILEDTLQFLKSVGQGATNPALVGGIKLTGRDLVNRIKRSAEYYLANSDCNYYVLLCDRIENVAKAKGETQSGRDKEKNVITHDSEFVTNIGMKKTQDMIKEYIEKEEVDEESLERTVCEISVEKGKKLNFVPEDGISYENRRPYLNLDETIPRDWDAALTDRERTAKHIIAWIAYQLFFSRDTRCRVQVPPGKLFMFEGHCLEKKLFDDLATTLGDNVYQNLFSKIKTGINDIDHMPLVMHTTLPKTSGTYSGPKEIIYFEPELYNTHGEADSTFFWYITKLGEMTDAQYFGIFSNDTDILFYSLWYMAKYIGDSPYHDDFGHIIWRFAPDIDWSLRFMTPNINFCSFVYINLLYQLIWGNGDGIDIPVSNSVFAREYRDAKKKEEEKKKKEEEIPKKKATPKEYEWGILRKQISEIDNPVQNLVISMIASGCDYIKGYYGITMEKFLFAVARNADYVGDLIKEKKHHKDEKKACRSYFLNGDAYARMILTAYMYSKPKRFTSDASRKKRKRAEEGDPNIEDIEPAEYNYKKIGEFTKTLGAKNRIPSKDFIVSSCLHLHFYLEMLDQLGKNKIIEPDHNTFGYSKIYAKEELGRKNIQKMFVLSKKMFE